MPIKVTAKGPLFARPTSRVISIAFREAADRHGPIFVARLKEQAPKDRKTFSDAIDYRVTGSGINSRLILFSNAPDAEWAEKGRKRGKQPPLEPTGETLTRGPNKGKPKMQSILVHWLERRGIGASIKERQSIAFLKSRAIGRLGTRGAFVFRDFRQNNPDEVALFYRELEEQLVRAFSE